MWEQSKLSNSIKTQLPLQSCTKYHGDDDDNNDGINDDGNDDDNDNENAVKDSDDGNDDDDDLSLSLMKTSDCFLISRIRIC